MKFTTFASVLALLAGMVTSSFAEDRLAQTAAEIEAELGARVGYAVYDVSRNAFWLHNADQRFPMASTFKVLACAALLASDIPDEPTARVNALEDYSPVTTDLVGQSVSPYRLCEITMRTSDNTAANLVLDALGGPPALTRYVRSLGDNVTRLDRAEPGLNEGKPGDERDTTTPRAIAATLGKLVLGDALSGADRDTLTGWLRANEVGGPLLRASIPAEWNIADRTGAGGYGTRGIVAAMWPSHQAGCRRLLSDANKRLHGPA